MAVIIKSKRISPLNTYKTERPVAKRLTDTSKWNDEWYATLSNDYRIVWQWLLDNCDHAGILKRGVRLLNFSCNTNLTEDQLLEVFNGRVHLVKDMYFIPKFIKFQYPEGIISKKPVIVSVVKILESNGLMKFLIESLGSDYRTITEPLDNDSTIIKSKSISKSKDKDQEKEPAQQNLKTGIVQDIIEDFKTHFPNYPVDHENDYPAALKIAHKIAAEKGWTQASVTIERRSDVRKRWGEYLPFIASDEWWSSKSLSFIASRQWQSMVQAFNSWKPDRPAEGTKKNNGKTFRELRDEKLLEEIHGKQ